MDSIVCWVCHKRIPSALQNKHHAKPQAAGGGPDDLVELCSGCHHSLHRISDMLSGPRAAQAEDTVKAYYQDDIGAARRCLELAIKVVKHMREKQNGEYRLALHDDVEILVEIPLGVKNALMLIGREARDPSTNRRLGLAGAVRRILIEFVLRRYPELGSQIKQSLDTSAKQNPDRMFVRPRRRVKERSEDFNVQTSEQTRPAGSQK